MRLRDVAAVLANPQLGGHWTSRRCRYLPIPSRLRKVRLTDAREVCYAPTIPLGPGVTLFGHGRDRGSRQPRHGLVKERKKIPTLNELLVVVLVRFRESGQAVDEEGRLLRSVVAPLKSAVRVTPLNMSGRILGLMTKPPDTVHSGLAVSVAGRKCASALVLLGTKVESNPFELPTLGILGQIQHASLVRGTACR